MCFVSSQEEPRHWAYKDDYTIALALSVPRVQREDWRVKNHASGEINAFMCNSGME